MARSDALPWSAAYGRTAFLFDIDNTLLDNDRVKADLRDHLTRELGPEGCARYFSLYEQLRAQLGYADFLGALQRYRLEDPRDQRVMLVSTWLLGYDFKERLYPGALAVLAQAARQGEAIILSDGDAVLQPHKIVRSGLWEACGGRMLIYPRKESMLAEVERLYPADLYVVFDDKPRILAAVKEHWGDRVVTVFLRQGHYATDPGEVASHPPADVACEHIGDVLGLEPTPPE